MSDGSRGSLRPDIVALLRCPHCGLGFGAEGGSLRCASGHTFDIARQGYVNLLPGDARSTTADTAEMVAARERFLQAGHFAGLGTRLADTVAAQAGRDRDAETRDGPDCVLDAGAGTAYYLIGILDRLPQAVGMAVDLSKHALRRAARAHERLGAVACDIWRGLPVRDGAVATVLDIFAPRNAVEFRRVLAPQGRLMMVTPTDRHLQELVSSLELVSVDPRKEQRVEETLAGIFAPLTSEAYEEEMTLAHDDIAALVGMGPSARHLQADELGRRLAMLPPAVAVTLSVTVSVYRPVS